jgi:hypothetical protein
MVLQQQRKMDHIIGQLNQMLAILEQVLEALH